MQTKKSLFLRMRQAIANICIASKFNESGRVICSILFDSKSLYLFIISVSNLKRLIYTHTHTVLIVSYFHEAFCMDHYCSTVDKQRSKITITTTTTIFINKSLQIIFRIVNALERDAKSENDMSSIS